jgi:hypothetical protein
MSLEKIECPINDSHLFQVTMVVAIPNYSIGCKNQHQITAIDYILQSFSDDEITVLEIKESKLSLWVTE